MIALLFFLAVTKRAGDLGQARVLVLDDALQSVDASVRLDVMDFVLENFSDWQLIITGHDRSWLNQLRRLYQAHQRSFNERMITRWTFDRGSSLVTRTEASRMTSGRDQAGPSKSNGQCDRATPRADLSGTLVAVRDQHP